MKLREVKLQNFRGYRVETAVKIDDFTVLIGRNDAGKSTILDALNIFFNGAPIDGHDASVGGESKNVRISCVFSDLPQQIVLDDQHPTTLGDEYLLREDGQLEICRVYNCSLKTPKESAVCAMARHPSAKGYSDLLGLKIEALKERAAKLGTNLEGVNQATKTKLRGAIWAQAADLELKHREVDLSKEAGATAWEQIQSQLPVFALFKSGRTSTDQDEEAQDPMKAAIKEAVKQHEQPLADVIAKVKVELETVAKKTVEKIREMSPDLAKTLDPQIKTKPWDSLFAVSLSGEDGISINKRGSGTRRLVLLNFFRARAEDASATKGTGTIYAIEEPETSQHPNHQLMLLDAFQEIVDQGAAQVILTTHTPTLARRVFRTSLRLVKVENGQPVIHCGSLDTTLAAIKDTLGVLPDNDVKVFVGVEGKWDIEFLKRISRVLHISDRSIPDLSLAESAGHLVFVPLGGGNLELWTNRLAKLDRPELYLTDRDVPPPGPPKYDAAITAWNARPNCGGRATCKRELENYLHPSVIQQIQPAFPAVVSDFDDIPMKVAELTHAANSPNPWAGLADEEKKRKASAAKKRLNQECVDQMNAALLQVSDPRKFIVTFLKDVAARLV